MTGRVLVYGATGFSGGLLVNALGAGCERVVLGGRNATALARMAASSGAEWRAFGLEEAAVIDAALGDIAVVVHCAGPFRDTAAPMMAACLRTGTHYLDLSGEWPVFTHAITLASAALSAGVVLLPGVGFAIAVTDCLLAMAATMPDCARLRLAVSRPRRIARGSVETILALNDAAVRVRRSGVVEALPAGRLSREFDFGQGKRCSVAVTWPDVFTAQGTTGIDSIETYIEGGWGTQAAIRFGAVFASATAAPTAAPWLRIASSLGNPAPAEVDGDAGIVVVAEAEDRWRRVRTLRIRTLDGYSVSTATAAAAVRRFLDDDQCFRGMDRAGFTTPARLFGADFILGLGCAEMMPLGGDGGHDELH